MTKSKLTIKTLGVAAIVFHGAIFGFFYAWVCSTLWGLDNLAAIEAIKAMNSMNGIVRNFVFMPAFFITPLVSLLAGLTLFISRNKQAAWYFIIASVLYFGGAFLVTAFVNVPMNQQLMQTDLTQSAQQLSVIWQNYSNRWQFYNGLRTVVSLIALISTAIGLLKIDR